jgi:glucosamine--fructose-6-phosphate aminotransferase (isomerizing)
MVKLGGLDSNEKKLLEIEDLIIGACGTSYHASLYGQHLFREFGCFPSVQVKIASEISELDFASPKGGLLGVS